MRSGQKPPDGWTVQAFKFALDPTDAQKMLMLRSMGINRKAHNWAVAKIKDNLEHHRTTGESRPAPNFFNFRKE